MTSPSISDFIDLFRVFPFTRKYVSPDDKVSSTINLFSSILSYRLHSFISSKYPDILIPQINLDTTYRDLYDCIFINPVYTSNHLPSSSPCDYSTPNISVVPDLSVSPFNARTSIGCDVENLNSFPDSIFSLEHSQLRSSLFHPTEILYASSRINPELSLLGIFSAKEAVIKSSSEYTSLLPKDILICHDSRSRPVVSQPVTALSFELSISHSHDVAFAVCLCTFFDTLSL